MLFLLAASCLLRVYVGGNDGLHGGRDGWVLRAGGRLVDEDDGADGARGVGDLGAAEQGDSGGGKQRSGGDDVDGVGAFGEVDVSGVGAEGEVDGQGRSAV